MNSQQHQYFPALSNQTTQVSRLSNFQNLKKWDRERKQAYRDELDSEVIEMKKSKQKMKLFKYSQKQQINEQVTEEKKKKFDQRYNKIKTEQKYMMDNYHLMKSSSKISKRINKEDNNAKYCHENPFVKLVDDQDHRNKETKQHFIYQNHLNDIQSQIKKEFLEKKKKNQEMQRQIFQHHVEQEYNKKDLDRMEFEKKYLKIGLRRNQCQKNEYLQYLKDKAVTKNEYNQSLNKYSENSNKSNIVNNSSAILSMLPVSLEKQYDFEKEKGIKYKEERLKSRQTSLEVKKQFDIVISNIWESNPKHNYEKILTEKSAIDHYIPHQNIQRSNVKDRSNIKDRLNLKDGANMKDELNLYEGKGMAKINISSRRPSSEIQTDVKNMIDLKPLIKTAANSPSKDIKRQFKQYDFIKGTEKSYLL